MYVVIWTKNENTVSTRGKYDDDIKFKCKFGEQRLGSISSFLSKEYISAGRRRKKFSGEIKYNTNT